MRMNRMQVTKKICKDIETVKWLYEIIYRLISVLISEHQMLKKDNQQNQLHGRVN